MRHRCALLVVSALIVGVAACDSDDPAERAATLPAGTTGADDDEFSTRRPSNLVPPW